MPPKPPHKQPYELPARLLQELKKADFSHPLDLLLNFPRRHEDWQNTNTTATLAHGKIALVTGDIISAETVPARGRRHFLVRLQESDGDIITLRFFHVTHGLKHYLEVGRTIRARGKASFNTRNGWEIAHPQLSNDNQMRSIYSAHKTLSTAKLQKLIQATLQQIQLPPLLPAELENFNGSEWTLKQALQAAHAPANDQSSPLPADHIAWQRLRYEELVAHQIILRRRYYYRRNTNIHLTTPADWQQQFNAVLPFTLTATQQSAIDTIRADLANSRPMRRLLQGDVGSGKTVVAAAACYYTMLGGYSAALLAPTEILAEQHYQSLSALFAPLNIHCELLTGNISNKQRSEAENRLRFGISSLAIGTHALFQQNTLLPRLGLAIIDEQHRFGVQQRQSFINKGEGTHQLMMSATPIPRTLALSLYADMDISVLNEKPAGRQPVRTILHAQHKRDDIIERVAKHIGNGGRVYWVCPLVEESEHGEQHNLDDVHTVAAAINHTQPQIPIGILHGRMKAGEKNSVMEKFRSGEYQLLAATTVIEVGVDVAQADVMVIERADRLGLSQLHQLRGRVGRGSAAGVCILLYQQPLSAEAQSRLKIMHQTDDGFEIARHDLAMRGPGEWLGSRQSGLPSLRVARLGEDQELVNQARATADWLLKNDPRTCILHRQRWLGNIR